MTDIDDFIQQDILVFLDAELEGTHSPKPQMQDDSLYVNRDFEEELLKALDMNNIVEAKHVLRDLKQRFDEVPVGTPEKSHMKFLLQSLYEKFRDHIEAASSFQEMDVALTRMSHGEEPFDKDDTSEPPSGPESLGETGADSDGEKDHESEPVREEPHKERTPKVEEDTPSEATPQEESSPADMARTLLDDAERLLRRGDVRGAVKAYREARKDVLKITDSVPVELAHKFRSLHERIRKSMEKDVSGLDHDLLLQMEREKKTLDGLLHSHDLNGAMRTYRRMRVLAQQISDPERAERAAEKMVRIHDIISKVAHVRRVP